MFLWLSMQLSKSFMGVFAVPPGRVLYVFVIKFLFSETSKGGMKVGRMKDPLYKDSYLGISHLPSSHLRSPLIFTGLVRSLRQTGKRAGGLSKDESGYHR